MARSSNTLPEGAVLRDRFCISRVLGAGGFGITYKAQDQERQIACAIKEYFPQEWAVRCQNHLTIEPKDVHFSYLYQHGLEVFVNEAKILYELQDDAVVVDVFHFFRENNTAYIVMEYVEGMNLAVYTEKNRKSFSVDELGGIIRRVAGALDKIHKLGLLHRDVSPDNIMISKSGDVKLIDFGATRQYAFDETTDMSVVIKPGFAPVEQYSRTGRQGPWTDVYALAATYYYLLTGRKPLTAVDRSAGEKMKSIRQIRPEVREYISRAIEKALALDYSKRTQSMEEFIRDLDKGKYTEAGPRLIVKRMGQIRRYRFGCEQSIRIGRSKEECDIWIGDNDISRIHCEVQYDKLNNVFIVRDYSLNGTFTDKGLVGKGHYAILQPGDSFYLVSGKICLELEVK